MSAQLFDESSGWMYSPHPPAYFIQLSGVGGHVSRGSRMRNLGIRKLSKIIKKKKKKREGNELEERQVGSAHSAVRHLRQPPQTAKNKFKQYRVQEPGAPPAPTVCGWDVKRRTTRHFSLKVARKNNGPCTLCAAEGSSSGRRKNSFHSKMEAANENTKRESRCGVNSRRKTFGVYDACCMSACIRVCVCVCVFNIR